ncbi:MAG TPA: Piwi domain-containing protein [Gemmatimonadaceae bacterium]|nr:Piwi domain-containing protein [Gemmatimonadaceae bacterium]
MPTESSLSLPPRRTTARPPVSPRRGNNASCRAPSQQIAGAAAAAGLTLNLFPATYSSDSVAVWVGRWTTPEDAAALADRVPGLVTWRDPDDAARMYAWHPREVVDLTAQRFAPVTVRLDESPRLFQRLTEDAVAARLASLGFTAKGGGWVNFRKPGLVASVPALAEACDSSVGIYPKIVPEAFITRDAAQRVTVALVVDVLYTTRLDITAAEWQAAGLGSELRDVYVTLLAGTPEAARHPDLVGRVVGCVDTVCGDRVLLTDLRDRTLPEVALTSVAPEATRANLMRYLLARYEKAFAAGERELTRLLRDLVRPKTRFDYARAFIFQRLQPGQGALAGGLPVLPGVTIRFGEPTPASDEAFPVRRLGEPEYSFDRAGNRFAYRIDKGLQQHGPYDSRQMSDRPLRLLVVAPVENKGDVTLGLQKLLAGVKTQKNVFTGLRTMYRLNKLQVTQVYADKAAGGPAARYATAIRRALEEAPPAPAGEPAFHLVLTVITEEHKRLPDSENPYFQTKALVLTMPRLNVPTQAVTVEKLRADDGNLQYILNTMAVAIYAKLGGTSHVLKLPADSEDAPTELVFGVGHAVRRVGRFGEAEETVGFATVFRANGEYLYNDSTPYCDAGAYERELEKTILRVVDQVVRYEQLADDARLRLIFHVPRRPGRREEQAILNAVGKLPRFRIEFALVHVNDDHHLQLFDTRATQPRTYQGQPKPEAALLPARGLSVAIGPRERLVTFIGVDQYRGHGSPTPLRLTLHRRSTFTDLDYLTRQLYLLSFMSAGSLTPGVAPVTITYARRLAFLTGRLRGVQQWAVDLIHQKLGRRLWMV